MDVKKIASRKKKKARGETAAQKHAGYKKLLADDQDWDYSFILKLLAHKLRRTAACIRGNRIIADADNVGAEIDQVVELLERVNAYDYVAALVKPIDEKYGEQELYFEPVDETGCSRMLHCYTKKLTKRQIAAADRAHLAAYRKADQMRRDDLALAMAIMAERMLGWWD